MNVELDSTDLEILIALLGWRVGMLDATIGALHAASRDPSQFELDRSRCLRILRKLGR